MSSQLPDARAGWKPKPLSALRRPCSLLKSSNPANPTAPPDQITPHCNDKPLHQIPITYSTIAARALSFHRQVLINVTPLQLAQNGLYCKPPSGLGGSACCFSCGSTKPLYTLQKNPIEEMQQLHFTDCIWQIICRDLKPTFERPNIVAHSATASPSPQQPPPETTPASILPDEPSTMNIDTATEQSTTIPEPGPQQPQPTRSPEISQPPPQPPQPPQSLHSTSPAPPPHQTNNLPMPQFCNGPDLLYRNQLPKFTNPYLLPLNAHSRLKTFIAVSTTNHRHSNSTRKPARAQLVELATKTHLLHTLSQLLAETQPAADNCRPLYRGIHYSRATRAA
ncbi:uncharacterized protein N7469_002022 [Penicillium citrinum]|uniref:Uncharacterized protein n=1 Tax=Penicillium citrinum TaxID=5077 RepID=A0A9W9PAD9_PENCI|nr:uncharacterized protein N7469_002022 [Penicillium citrinum]KAJ5240431.1 hypothetical protein N7469_002022 [Penicillium citrinum]